MKKNRLIRKVDNYINDKNFWMIYKNHHLNVINYTKILDFSPSVISFEHQERAYHIEGENLVISKMMDNEILVTGNIKKITFI